jgi:hypothetical protein
VGFSVRGDSSMGAIALMRTELYILMYAVAREHRDLAKQAGGKDMILELKESMISILFAYTCLEAYINTVAKDGLKREWEKYEFSSTETKWLGVSKTLATKKHGKSWSVFSKSKEPFKSFMELERIREDTLVHRKANFDILVPTKYGNTAATFNTLNCEKAEWACNVVKDMVNQLTDNMDNPMPITWAGFEK